MATWLTNASAHRPIGRYRRSKRRKSWTSLKLVADRLAAARTDPNPEACLSVDFGAFDIHEEG